MVSILLLSFLFIPANWISYSKSDTALNPLNMMFDLYYLHRSVVKELNVKILIYICNSKFVRSGSSVG